MMEICLINWFIYFLQLSESKEYLNNEFFNLIKILTLKKEKTYI